MTDGLSNVKTDLTPFEAFQLKAVGIEIFVVAVGGFEYGIQEIIMMASSTDKHVHRVNNFQGFLDVVQLIPPYPVPKIPMYKLP